MFDVLGTTAIINHSEVTARVILTDTAYDIMLYYNGKKINTLLVEPPLVLNQGDNVTIKSRNYIVLDPIFGSRHNEMGDDPEMKVNRYIVEQDKNYVPVL